MEVFTESINGSEIAYGKVIGIITVVALGTSVLLTAISEFSGVEAMNVCNAASRDWSKEEVIEFSDATTMLNHLWSIVVLFIVIIIGGGLFAIYDNKGKSNNAFGRRAKCSRGKGLRR